MADELATETVGVDPLREAIARLTDAGVTPERGPWKAEGGSIGFRSPEGFYFRLIGEDIEALVNAALASPAPYSDGTWFGRVARHEDGWLIEFAPVAPPTA